MIDLLNIFPEIFIFSAAICLLMFGVGGDSKINSSIRLLSLCSLFLAGVLLYNQPIQSSNFLFYSCVIDNFSFFLKSWILLSAFVVILISSQYLLKVYSFENLILMLVSVATMMMLVSSYDLLPLYLTVELQSLCFYVLAASKRTCELSTEAGLKYFLLGAFSSGILLFGFSLLYGLTGMTNFEDLAKLGAPQIALVFISVGFLFKLSAVPFHMWSPDVYEGSPTYVTAFFAIVPKIAILGVIVRFFLMLTTNFFLVVFVLSSLASMMLGAVAAMAQSRIKRLLAYSSIGHVGLILAGFCCGTIEGIQALLIYIVIYMIMSCGIFSIVLSLKAENSEIGSFGSLGKTNPALALTFTIILFSMAGIPPLAGFCSKFYLFFAALSSSLYLLAFVGVLASVISCFYYIRLIKIMYFENNLKHNLVQVSFENSIILAFVGLFLILFFIYPSPLFLWTHKTAIALCF